MMTRPSAAATKELSIDSALLRHLFVLNHVEPRDPAFDPRRRHASMHVFDCHPSLMISKSTRPSLRY